MNQTVKNTHSNSMIAIRSSSVLMLNALDRMDYEVALCNAYDIFFNLVSEELDTATYEDLYWCIQDEVIPLRIALWDDYCSGKIVIDTFYNSVQHKIRALPRLYLLVLLGSLVIKKDISLFEKISSDLLDMCKAIQAPVKGLYLRKFLLDLLKHTNYAKLCKDDQKLRSSAVKFLIENFKCMNRLWVRLAYLMYTEEVEKHSNAHEKLKILVRSCVDQVSELVCIEPELYRGRVLPELLNEVKICNERKSQEILIKYIFDLFQPKLNAVNLQYITSYCSNLHLEFDYHQFVIDFGGVVQKCLKLCSKEDPDLSEFNTVRSFSDCVSEFLVMVENRISVDKALSANTCVLSLILNHCSDDTELIVDVMGKFVKAIKGSSNGDNSLSIKESEATELKRMLYLLIKSKVNLNVVLDLEHFNTLTRLLSERDRFFIAMEISKCGVESSLLITSVAQLKNMMRAVDILLLSTESISTREYSLRQNYVAFTSVVICMWSTDFEVQLKFYITLKAMMLEASSEARQFVVPTVVSCILRYLNWMYHHQSEAESTKYNDAVITMFKLCFDITRLLSRPFCANVMVQLLLLGASCSDRLEGAEYRTITENFIREAFTVSEEDIVSSHEQMLSLNSFVGCLFSLVNIEEETYMQLSSRCGKIAGGFVSYSYQCYGLVHVSSLYWKKGGSADSQTCVQPDKVRLCLERALRVISSCIGEVIKTSLYSDLLNRCCYFCEEMCESIDPEFVDEIISKADAEVKQVDVEADDGIITHFNAIKARYCDIRAAIPRTESGCLK